MSGQRLLNLETEDATNQIKVEPVDIVARPRLSDRMSHGLLRYSLTSSLIPEGSELYAGSKYTPIYLTILSRSARCSTAGERTRTTARLSTLSYILHSYN
jgi:hypothetical protein